MKVNEKISKDLIEMIELHLNDLKEEIDEHLEEIREAETVEEIVDTERKIINTLLRYSIGTSYTSYFCLKQREVNDGELICHDCEYGKVHGICSKDDSDYGIIRKGVNDLISLINSLYYKGEKYEEGGGGNEVE